MWTVAQTLVIEEHSPLYVSRSYNIHHMKSYAISVYIFKSVSNLVNI